MNSRMCTVCTNCGACSTVEHRKEKEMLYGFDASGWQTTGEIKRMANGAKFCFLKVSEGRTWRDARAAEHVKYLTTYKQDCRIGFYHYCRPDLGNRPEDEAENFVAAVKSVTEEFGIKEFAMVIDWEDKAIGREVWLGQFTEQLMGRVYGSPILYVSHSNVKECSRYVDTDTVGLWVAKWNDAPLKGINVRESWPVVAFHQYTNNPYDSDVFNGTEEQMEKYFECSLDKSTLEDGDNSKECGCSCSCCQAGR